MQMKIKAFSAVMILSWYQRRCKNMEKDKRAAVTGPLRAAAALWHQHTANGMTYITAQTVITVGLIQ